MRKLTEEMPPCHVKGRTIFQIKKVQGILMAVAVCDVRRGADPAELCALLNKAVQENERSPQS